MPHSNLDHPGAKKMIFTSLVKYGRFSLGCVPWFDSTRGVLLLNEIIGVLLVLLSFNFTPFLF